MKRILVVVASTIVLGACAYLQEAYQNNRDFGTGTDPYEKISFAGEIATPGERARCEAAGGEIRPDGRRGWQQCIQTFADAGKTCSDSDDCLGECRVDLNSMPAVASQPVTGACQVNDSPFGCHATVEDGVAQPAICVD